MFEVEPNTSFDIFANSVLRQIAFVTKRNPLKSFGSETCAILFQLKCCSSYFLLTSLLRFLERVSLKEMLVPFIFNLLLWLTGSISHVSRLSSCRAGPRDLVYAYTGMACNRRKS